MQKIIAWVLGHKRKLATLFVLTGAILVSLYFIAQSLPPHISWRLTVMITHSLLGGLAIPPGSPCPASLTNSVEGALILLPLTGMAGHIDLLASLLALLLLHVRVIPLKVLAVFIGIWLLLSILEVSIYRLIDWLKTPDDGGSDDDDSQRSGRLPRRQNIRNLFLEMLLLSVFLIPALAVAGIGALHTTLWLVIAGSSAVLYILLPLAANLLAVAVVFLRNPMHSLLSLIGVFLNVVAIFVAAGAEFLGLVILIVYVGAVAILFLFVIMLLNVKSLTAGFSLLQHLFQKASFAFAPALTIILPSRLIPGFFIQAAYSAPLSDAQESTTAEMLVYYVNYVAADVMSFATLYTDQVALFLLITCVLLIAMLGAIVLATVTLEEDEPLASVHSSQAPLSPSVVWQYSSRPIRLSCRGHPFHARHPTPLWKKLLP